MVTVGIIEDDNKLRELFTATLELIGASVAFACSSMEELKFISADVPEPFLVFLDLGLPGISGLDGIGIINDYYPDAHLVVVTGNGDRNTIWNAITRRAKGYLIKPIKMQNIQQQIQIVVDGGALISPEVGNLLVSKVHADNLFISKDFGHQTKREKKEISYQLKGLSYKEVARYMNIEVSTVNDFVKKIYPKMNVHSKTELLALFI
jgi:DNA-binding NarL/FixJ family response regulator